MKKGLLSVLFLALAGFGLPALAQVPLSGFYLGGSIGLADARSVCTTNWLPAGTTLGGCDDKDQGWKIYGGYQFTPHWGAEAGYVDFGKQRWAVAIGGVTPAIAEAEANAWYLSGTATLPITPEFGVFGKLGLYGSDVDVRANGFSANGSSTDYMWGVGAKWNFGRNWSMRIEWERFNNAGSGSIGTTDYEMLSIGAIFRF